MLLTTPISFTHQCRLFRVGRVGTRRRESGETVRSWLDWIGSQAQRRVHAWLHGMKPPDYLRGTQSTGDHVTGGKVFSDTPAQTSPEFGTATESFAESNQGGVSK